MHALSTPQQSGDCTCVPCPVSACFLREQFPQGFIAPVINAQNPRCMLRQYSYLRCTSITSADSLSGLCFCGRQQQFRHLTVHGRLRAIGWYFGSGRRCTRRRGPVVLPDQAVPVRIRLRRSKRHPLPWPRLRTRPTSPPPARRRTFERHWGTWLNIEPDYLWRIAHVCCDRYCRAFVFSRHSER
jgi:hypothetical protein